MSWNIVSKEEASRFIRIPTNQLDDIWYDITLSIIENYTGWEELETEHAQITETLDGEGGAYIATRMPLKSLSALSIMGVSMPAQYYDARWDGIYLKTYRSPETIVVNTGWFDAFSNLGAFFPIGTSNVTATYIYGGYANLPKTLQGTLKVVLLMILREFTIYPRNEGSDQIMKVYKAGLHGAEALKVAGTHGKINGILEAFMPPRFKAA